MTLPEVRRNLHRTYARRYIKAALCDAEAPFGLHGERMQASGRSKVKCGDVRADRRARARSGAARGPGEDSGVDQPAKETERQGSQFGKFAGRNLSMRTAPPSFAERDDPLCGLRARRALS